MLALRHPSCRYPVRCRPTRISCGQEIIPSLNRLRTPSGTPPSALPLRYPVPVALNIQDRDTIQLATLQVMVRVRSAQMADPELASALALFRRAANVIARLEDAVVFRGLSVPSPTGFIPPGGVPPYR